MRAGSLLGLLLLCAPARASEVWASDDGASVLEVGGYYKVLGAILVLPGGLVDGTGALVDVVEAAGQLDPSARLPHVERMPRDAALSTHAARIRARLVVGSRVDVEAAWQLGAQVASDAALGGGFALGGSAASASSSTASRRLVDLDPVLVEAGTYRLLHDLDRLSVKVSLGSVDLVAGRQVLAWGSGKLWNPTDLLSPFPPAEIDKEVRRGVDALRVSVPLGTTGLLDALWLPQRRAEDNGGVFRSQLNLLGYDFSVSAAKYVSDLVFGADFSGDAGPLGVHGEAAYTLGVDGWGEGALRVKERFSRAVAGLEWRPLSKLFLVAEYYFNGFGAKRPEEYLRVLASDRVARGEIFGAGRHYLGVAASWSATDLLLVQSTALVNLMDPSAMLVPVLEYSLEQQVLLRAGAFVPLGAGPDPRSLRALTPDDVLTHSDAFLGATSTMGFRSEYGSAGAGAFVQIAIHR